MADKACMYTTQGELRCCPTNQPSCFYDFSQPTVNITKHTPNSMNNMNSMPSMPVVIDEQRLVERFTKHAPTYEYFQNDPKGVYSDFVSTCQSVPEASM